MKKLALSLAVIAASAAYVWEQPAKSPDGDLIGAALPASGTETADIPRLVPAIQVAAPPKAPPPAIRATLAPLGSDAPIAPGAPAADASAVPLRPQAKATAPSASRSVIVDVPLPRGRPPHAAVQARVTRIAMTVAANGAYADGTYTGSQADAYYGYIRIQAIVQGGRLVAIKVLEYPSDRRTSVAINRQALPMLRDEVIATQSAKVDIISGATLTSRAFIESLGAALSQAGQTL